MADRLHKYPRTPHIRGSRLQEGDEDLEAVPLEELAGMHLVVEEKIDGANAGISFASDGTLRLQSRGHFLTGGPRERQFALLKTWATTHRDALHDLLGDRYVLYGEWMYAKHTVFYDRLPHYLFEFDILDTAAGEFLSTPARREMLGLLPFRVESVRVLHEGPVRSVRELSAMIGPSAFKGPDWRGNLRRAAAEAGVDPERAAGETDGSDLMEGLYIKAEEGGRVVGRYKFIRPDFVAAVLSSGGHWADRPVVPNRLAEGADIFS
jgi:hypothetical protein